MNHHAGFDYVKKIIGSKYRINMVTPLNHGRHLLIQAKKDGQDKFLYFYCLFKHTTLHSFNNLAKDFVNSFPEFEGHGESINLEFLEYARRRESTLLYIYPDGKIYEVESNAVYKFSHNNGLVREQGRINEYLEDHDGKLLSVLKNEQTAFFPVKLMARYY